MQSNRRERLRKDDRNKPEESISRERAETSSEPKDEEEDEENDEDEAGDRAGEDGGG